MLENTNKQKGRSNMRQYPIWVDMNNNSYNSSKSFGVRDFAIQHVKVGTSSRNTIIGASGPSGEIKYISKLTTLLSTVNAFGT